MRANINLANNSLLKTNTIEVDQQKLKKLYKLYKEFKAEKRNFANIKNEKGRRKYSTVEQYCKYIRNEALKISSNIQELANLAVIITYETHPSDSKNFAWSVFNEGILANVMENKQKECFIPLINENGGDINYLGKNYSLQKVDVNKEINNDYMSEYS